MLLRILLLPILLFVTLLLLGNQDGGAWRPLDLPVSGVGGDDTDEDAPETIIFYGGEYEGDSFAFIIDTSGSMWYEDRLETAKQELISSLNSLSDQAEFCIVAFSHGLNTYSTTMVRATPNAKVSAAVWVTSLSPQGSTCIDLATVQGLNIINASPKPASRKKVILLGDGAQSCSGLMTPEVHEQVLADISLANWDRISIDTVFLGNATWDQAILLFQDIAAHNNGAFRTIN